MISMMPHPAIEIPLDLLVEQLEERVNLGLISKKTNEEGLSIYNYTKQCISEKAWDRYTLMSRGLVLSKNAIVALPFPKFFNVFEQNEIIPNLPFETFDKLDGSLIILFFYNGRWQCATKGSFHSDQARWAQNWLQAYDLDKWLDPSVTYLLEAIYKQNRIVVKYAENELVLLSAYGATGYELTYEDLFKVGKSLEWNVAYRYGYKNFADLVTTVKQWPAQQEGVVVRFADGYRLKVKSEEYLKIHRVVTGLTPLTVWGLLQAGNDLIDYKKDLPEEFWNDFNHIVALLAREFDRIFLEVVEINKGFSLLSDKQIGLELKHIEKPYRQLVFPMRKRPDKCKEMIYKLIRPTGNRLAGYTPTALMQRVQEEDDS